MLDITTKTEQDTLTISVSGRLDTNTAPELEAKIMKVGEQITHLIYDMKELAYISSAGIRVLLMTKKRIKDTRLIHVSNEVYDVISITGLEDIFGLSRAEVLPEEAMSPSDESREASAWHQEKADIPLTGINDSFVPFHFRPVTAMFEEQAERLRDADAVVSHRGSFTYRELNENANRIANYLIYMGAGVGDRVLIMLERGIENYAATLGVLKAGAAYTIVNVQYPDERIEYICGDAGCRYIISTREIVYDRLELFVDQLQKRPLFYEDMVNFRDTENPGVDIHPEDLCYMIYTSGSTGKPKGVMIEHRNLSNFLLDDPKNYEYKGLADHSNCILAMAQMTFDVSVMEEYIPLVSGKKVAYALFDEISNPDRMIDLMVENQVDGACFTPSYLSGLLKLPRAAEAVKNLKVIDFGAEAFPGSLYQKLRECNPEVLMMNGYGPTEATISCTMKVIESAEHITIGRPNANVYVFVIDEENREVPRGETGELLICGDGVGAGYINLPEKTAEAFITFHGLRGYKSGDLVRINEEDEIEYLGRKDHQVKIRGLRIELEEVEAVMQSMPGIDMCVGASVKGKYLCLYYTEHTPLSEKDIREYAKEHLAHYMVPDLYVRLDTMPVTANFKADRKALPEPTVPEEAVTEPETEDQRKIIGLLHEVLEEGSFGMDTNIMELGLSSLDLMIYLSLIGENYHIAMGLNDLTEHPTVEALAEFAASAPKLKKQEKKEKYPATMVQLVDYLSVLRGDGNVNMPTLYELEKTVDDERLREAIYLALEAHPGCAMRLELDEENNLWQIPRQEIRSYEIETLTMSDEELEQKKHAISERFGADAKYLFRFRIIHTDTGKYLLADYSHLISDGISVEIMMEDIIAAYEGKKLKPESFTMYEFGDLMSDFWESKAGKRCMELYLTMLSETGGAVTFPTDKKEEKWDPKRLAVALPVEPEKLSRYCKKHFLSESEVLAAAFGLVLAKYTGRDNVAFSFGFSGRSDSRLNNTVGYIASLLEVFCFTRRYRSVTEYLEAFKKGLLNLMMYPTMPLSQVLGEYPNAIDITYLYQPKETVSYTMDGTAVKAEFLQEVMPNEAVKLIVQPTVEQDDTITWNIDYHGNLYSEVLMERLAADLNKVVCDIMEEREPEGFFYGKQ